MDGKIETTHDFDKNPADGIAGLMEKKGGRGMKGKSIIRVLLAAIVCAALIIGYYYYISNHTKQTAQDTEPLNEIQQVLTIDIDASYPKTPKAVVKLYNRIACCFYNEKCSDEEIKELGGQERKLLDDDLLAENDEESYYSALKTEILDYRSAERTISKVTMNDSDEVEYKRIKGEKCAYVKVAYFIKEGSSYSRTEQYFVLRQDEEQHWKILGFYQDKGKDEMENES